MAASGRDSLANPGVTFFSDASYANEPPSPGSSYLFLQLFFRHHAGVHVQNKEFGVGSPLKIPPEQGDSIGVYSDRYSKSRPAPVILF